MAVRPELRELLANVDSPPELAQFLEVLQQWLRDPDLPLPPVPPKLEKRADPSDDAWVLFED